MALSVKIRRKKKAYERLKKGSASQISMKEGYRKYVQAFYLEVESKEVQKIINDWFKANKSRTDYAAIMKNEIWRWSKNHIAAYCYWDKNGPEKAPEETVEWMENYFQELIQRGKQTAKKAKKKEEKTPSYRPSIQDRMREQLADIVAQLEEWIDEQPSKTLPKIFEYLKSNNVAQAHIKPIREYYSPMREEFVALTKKDCPSDLLEGYSHLTKTQIKLFIVFFDHLLTELDLYENTKKATRKKRTPRPMTKDKQIKNIKYKKEDSEYKLASIDPINIIDASYLYVFNTRYKEFIIYVSESGLTMKGTTLQNFNSEMSVKKKLRKPEEFLKDIMKKTPKSIEKLFNELSTKPSNNLPGRINADCIILKAIK